MLLYLSVFLLMHCTTSILAGKAEDCLPTEECIEVSSCRPIMELLRTVKRDSARRSNITAEVAKKICGDQYICCTKDEDQAAAGALFTNGEPGEDAYLGKFINIYHDISGKVYKLSDSQVVIKGFTYDGEGPDAFFLGGQHGVAPKNTKADVVLPYPFDNKFYRYLDKDIPILNSFDGTKDVVLTLPPSHTVDQLKWISVWCRDYKVDFGHATFTR